MANLAESQKPNYQTEITTVYNELKRAQAKFKLSWENHWDISQVETEKGGKQKDYTYFYTLVFCNLWWTLYVIFRLSFSRQKSNNVAGGFILENKTLAVTGSFWFQISRIPALHSAFQKQLSINHEQSGQRR